MQSCSKYKFGCLLKFNDILRKYFLIILNFFEENLKKEINLKTLKKHILIFKGSFLRITVRKCDKNKESFNLFYPCF